MSKRNLLLLFLTLNTYLTFSQVKTDLPEFLLGMFNDYGGKQFVPEHPMNGDLVTRFYCSEKALADLFLDSLKVLNKKYNYKIMVNDSSFINIHSSNFKDLFKFYYKVKSKPDFQIYELVEDNEVEYDVFKGVLNRKKFITKNQRLSFLMGVFLAHGELTNNNGARLLFANSGNHFKISQVFLKQLGFKIREVNISKNTTPTTQKITFEIAAEYKSLFKYLKSIQPIADYNNCD